MLVHQVYRYELKPNDRQRTLFLRYAGLLSISWNGNLERREQCLRKRRKLQRRLRNPL